MTNSQFLCLVASMTSFLLFRGTFLRMFFMLFFLLVMSTMSAMARHTPATEKMHGNKDNKEEYENPVLSYPIHIRTSLFPFNRIVSKGKKCTQKISIHGHPE